LRTGRLWTRFSIDCEERLSSINALQTS
jgi:hypothetical protein